MNAHPTQAGMIAALSTGRSEREFLGRTWRNGRRDIAEHIEFIRSHLKTIANRDERLPSGRPVNRPEYVAYAEKRLAERLPEYLQAVRDVTEAELALVAIGFPPARSSDAWNEAELARAA